MEFTGLVISPVFFRDFEKTLDHLQADIDTLETERKELKEKMKSMSKKALIEGLSKSTGVGSLGKRLFHLLMNFALRFGCCTKVASKGRAMLNKSTSTLHISNS